MKHLLMNKENENSGAGAPKNEPDVTKILQDSFKQLNEQIGNLSKRLDSQTKATAPAPKAKEETVEEDLGDLLLVNPSKAVERITKKVENEVSQKFGAKDQAAREFSSKFVELSQDYPEINSQSSDLYQRAFELLQNSATKENDVGALERAVLRAASEKGVLPMKHRKQSRQDQEDQDGDEYLGGNSGASPTSSRSERRDRNKKLPAATLAFAQALGLNTSDPKVVERLQEHHVKRSGNWNRYR